MISSDNYFAMRFSNPIDKREKSATTSDESILLWPPLTKVSSRDHLWRKYQTNSLTSKLDAGRCSSATNRRVSENAVLL